MVFFFGKQTKDGLRTAISGFSSGVMVAACVWSLLIPAMELAESKGVSPALPAAIGFSLGVLFFLICDKLIFLREQRLVLRGGKQTPRVFLTCFAIALHNLPEGMAVGAVFAEVISGADGAHMSAAMALSIGIAVQNFPEGAIVSMPLASEGVKKSKAFIYGVLSGAIEPIGALFTILAISFVIPILPYLLGFAAGAMIYAVIKELLPIITENSESNVGIISFAMGFSFMMILDVALG